MQKSKFYILSFALALTMPLLSCKDDINYVEPDVTPNDVIRQPIELCVNGIDGGEEKTTRAIITDRTTDKIFNPLPENTNIFMVMKSEYVELPAPNGFEGPHDTKYCVTAGKVAEDNKVVFEGDRMRYWDDIQARCSNLSIWAITCPGLNYVGGTGTNQNYLKIKFNQTEGLLPWQTTAINANSIEWNIPHDGDGTGNFQDVTTVQNRDLCYSNNIANYSGSTDASIPDGSKTDRRLKFDTSTRKFAQGKMVFYHAMSKITINIKMGEGFSGTDDFRFTTGSSDATKKNVVLRHFNVWGKFNVETGLWTQVNTAHKDSKGMYDHMSGKPNITDNTKPTYQLEALVVPYLETDSKTSTKGSLIDNTDTEAFVFDIDNVQYKVSRKVLLKALKDNSSVNGIDAGATSVPMEQGKHYIFTFTVSKSRIDQITASITDWKTIVTNNQTPSNARVNLMLEERGEALSDNDEATIYRASETSEAYNWSTGYVGNSNTLKKTNDNWGLETVWFWPDNKTYYHFRAIMPKDETVTTDGTTTPNVDYIVLASGQIGSYKDIRWGAPMLDDKNDNESGSFKWTYTFDKGFGENNASLDNKNQIYHAIGATNDWLKFTLFHMMSEINVKLTTTNEADNVELSKTAGDPAQTTFATVELLDYKDGRLLLGNGKVETTGDAKNTVINKKSEVFEYPYGVVPQNLDNVKLRIKTADDNVYIVNLKDAIANTDTNADGATTNLTSNNITNPYKETATGSKKYKISDWYPGFKYEYNINLTKKGIDKVGVKLVDWNQVEMDEEGIQIK